MYKCYERAKKARKQRDGEPEYMYKIQSRNLEKRIRKHRNAMTQSIATTSGSGINISRKRMVSTSV